MPGHVSDLAGPGGGPAVGGTGPGLSAATLSGGTPDAGQAGLLGHMEVQSMAFHFCHSIVSVLLCNRLTEC